MSELLEFPVVDSVTIGRQLRRRRESAGLTMAQAAISLGISPITLDGWEQGRKPQISPEDADLSFTKFRSDTNACRRAGNNILFGVFPIRIARDILQLSLEDMANEFGYSSSSWSKMEANARIVPKDKLKQIETQVAEAWSAACMMEPELS